MRISDWSSDVCSSDLRGLLELVGLEPVDGSAIERAAGRRAGQQREPEQEEPRPAALAPQERLPRLLCLVVLHQFSPKLWCLGGMVGPSWLTKRDRTGGPDGPRAGLALASGGLSSYEDRKSVV